MALMPQMAGTRLLPAIRRRRGARSRARLRRLAASEAEMLARRHEMSRELRARDNVQASLTGLQRGL